MNKDDITKLREDFLRMTPTEAKNWVKQNADNLFRLAEAGLELREGVERMDCACKRSICEDWRVVQKKRLTNAFDKAVSE